MKGIIAEVHSRHMIVIAKNGDFIKCKKLPNCNIGDEVNLPARSMTVIYKRISTIAASFIILAMLSTGVYAYYTPYSYVSVDINPSLELSVNRFERVVGVHAFNADAEKVLAATANIKNKGIENALEQILDSAADKGYLKQEGENSVMIVVSSNSKKEEADLTNKISKTSTAALAKVSGSYEVILENTKVESFKKAHKENISPGKVILANEFKEVKPEIDEEKIKHMPLQQVIKEIEKKEDKAVKPDKSNTAAVNEKPDVKAEPKYNVKNVKELIKEKNEELGKKLEKNKSQNKDKKENKNDADESFNQNNAEDDKQKKNENSNNKKDDESSTDAKGINVEQKVDNQKQPQDKKKN